MSRHGGDNPWRRDEIESPCVQICVIHPEARICAGCHRTTEEIAVWSRLSPEARRMIMDDLPGRGSLLRQRRGGRARRRGERGGEHEGE